MALGIFSTLLGASACSGSFSLEGRSLESLPIFCCCCWLYFSSFFFFFVFFFGGGGGGGARVALFCSSIPSIAPEGGCLLYLVSVAMVGVSGYLSTKSAPVVLFLVTHVFGSKPMVPFGVGAPPILVYFSGDWDVDWGYDLDFDRWACFHHPSEAASRACPGC